MTLREKIADWVSGGKVSAYYGWRDAYRELDRIHLDRLKHIAHMREYLMQIKALETPNMAHVGKKAVALAKKGLGKE